MARCISNLPDPARALIRFYSSSKPKVLDQNQPVTVAWDATTRIGRLEISRGTVAEALTIRFLKDDKLAALLSRPIGSKTQKSPNCASSATPTCDVPVSQR